MLHNRTELKLKVGERDYCMVVDPNAPLGELYDVLNQMRGYVIERMVAENEQIKKSESIEKSESSEKEKKNKGDM